jgi:hypothetical protein
MNVENCSNCGRVIGKLEQAYTLQNHILCKGCYARLSSPTEVPTMAQEPTTQGPIDVHIPTRSLVKSTLIVIATVLGVIVAIYFLAFLLEFLAFHIHQFKTTGDW